MKSSTFYIHWRSFWLGLLLGIIGVVTTLFARTDRRDKFYSSLLGMAICMGVNMWALKYVLKMQ
jgi:uncharacterized membrane protein